MVKIGKIDLHPAVYRRLLPGDADEARQKCFAECRTGAFIDHEVGCLSICSSPRECGGWVPFLVYRPHGGDNIEATEGEDHG